MQAGIFDLCDDTQLEDNKKNIDYCETLFLGNGNYTLWDDHIKQKSCEDTVKKTVERCNTQIRSSNGDIVTDCHSCGYSISYFFSRYEAFVVSSLENIFKNMFDKIAYEISSAEPS